MQPDTELATFRELLSTCTSEQKHSMLLLLTESIKQDKVAARTTRTINFSDFVEVVPDFLPANFLDEAIIAEVESMCLDQKSSKPQSQWLAFEKSDYCFSDNHKLKHPSKDLADFPNICKLIAS